LKMPKPLPLFFHIHIGNNNILPVHVFDSTINKKKNPDKQSENKKKEHWFKDEHKEELYKLLKPFLQSKLEKSKNDRNTVTVSMDGKTIEIIRGKKIQFTYEFKPNTTKYY